MTEADSIRKLSSSPPVGTSGSLACGSEPSAWGAICSSPWSRQRDPNRSNRTATMKSKSRILVAEDHLIARVGLTSVINMQRDMTVVAEALNGQQAVSLFRKHLPDAAV